MPKIIFAFCRGIRYFFGGITLNVTIAAAMFAAVINIDTVTHTGRKDGLVSKGTVPFDDAGTSGRERLLPGGVG